MVLRTLPARNRMNRFLLGTASLDCKKGEGMLFASFAQNMKRYIADPYARLRGGGKASVVRVTVQRQHRLVAFQRPRQAGAAKERKDRLRLADNRLLDGRVVRDCDLLLCMQLSQAVIELDRFALCYLNKGLDSLFSEWH